MATFWVVALHDVVATPATSTLEMNRSLSTEAAGEWLFYVDDFDVHRFRSGRPGSNRRQLAWKANALPTELHPQCSCD